MISQPFFGFARLGQQGVEEAGRACVSGDTQVVRDAEQVGVDRLHDGR